MDDEIIDYGHSRTIGALFGAVLLSLIGYGLYIMITDPGNPSVIIDVYARNSFIIAILSIIFGIGSKKSINYIPGKWASSKRWVTFGEYDTILEKYKKAYGGLFAKPGDQSACCFCYLPILMILALFSVFYQEIVGPMFGYTLDTILTVPLFHGLIGFAGFLIGFRSVTIDSDEFFKAPEMGDNYEYARALSNIPYLRAGVNVELGERKGMLTLLNAEWKIFVKDLPEAVAVQVQVSHSGFAYPYLVGTIYKGPVVEKREETLKIGTRYPAIIEYSMDDDVTVMVARFKIPSRTSSVPSISTTDFQKLGAMIAGKLTSYYEKAT